MDFWPPAAARWFDGYISAEIHLATSHSIFTQSLGQPHARVNPRTGAAGFLGAGTESKRAPDPGIAARCARRSDRGLAPCPGFAQH